MEYRARYSGMIIWSGCGIFIVLALVFSVLGFGSSHAGQFNDMDLAYSFFVTGLFSGVCGWLLRKRSGRTVIDKATGQEMVLRRSHSLFFIPMLYWGPIFAIGGLYLVIKHLFIH